MALRHKSVHSSKKRARQWILPSYYGYVGDRKPANTDPVSHFNHTDSVVDLQQNKGETNIGWTYVLKSRCFEDYFEKYKYILEIECYEKKKDGKIFY